jgi:hypothetical protein
MRLAGKLTLRRPNTPAFSREHPKSHRDFERWLAKQLLLVRPDVRLKHEHTAEAPFSFLRATFYRWLQLWPEVCSDLANAPSVLAVGERKFVPGSALLAVG